MSHTRAIIGVIKRFWEGLFMEDKKLAKQLADLHHKNYKLYKGIKGSIDFPQFKLVIDHVQGDPFAAPSKMRVMIPHTVHLIPNHHFENQIRTVALRDYITRIFHKIARSYSKRVGTGKGGQIGIDEPGQQILDRSSCFVHDDHLEIRFTVGLPADGRRILGHEAASILCNWLPDIIEQCLFKSLDADHLEEHINCHEDNIELRAQLKGKKLICFVGNDSQLPRASGIDDQPLKSSEVVRFKSPDSLEITLNCPHRGEVKGLGIPEGITLIVGGGYHGKSTLLNAIELGVYSHIPGDGRELVVTEETAFKVRSEDGRSVKSVPIFPFINNLPQGKSTKDFSTENASGSTSQASNIIEAIEAGSKTLLIDEDTSATNFMIRDRRMQELINETDEPITPLVDRISDLKNIGISTILVMGGSGAYFEYADHVVGLKSYRCSDLLKKVHDVISRFPSLRNSKSEEIFSKINTRKLMPEGLSPKFRHRDLQIKTRKTEEIQYGHQNIDISHIEQLVHESQLKTIGYMIAHLHKTLETNGSNFKQALDSCLNHWSQNGYDGINELPDGDMAEVRSIELACSINRLRSLQADV